MELIEKEEVQDLDNLPHNEKLFRHVVQNCKNPSMENRGKLVHVPFHPEEKSQREHVSKQTVATLDGFDFHL